jgi:hypothetical protein
MWGHRWMLADSSEKMVVCSTESSLHQDFDGENDCLPVGEIYEDYLLRNAFGIQQWKRTGYLGDVDLDLDLAEHNPWHRLPLEMQQDWGHFVVKTKLPFGRSSVYPTAGQNNQYYYCPYFQMREDQALELTGGGDAFVADDAVAYGAGALAALDIIAFHAAVFAVIHIVEATVVAAFHAVHH